MLQEVGTEVAVSYFSNSVDPSKGPLEPKIKSERSCTKPRDRHVVDCLCRVTYKHVCNQAVVERLVQEVHGVNPTFTVADIRGKFNQGYTVYS